MRRLVLAALAVGLITAARADDWYDSCVAAKRGIDAMPDQYRKELEHYRINAEAKADAQQLMQQLQQERTTNAGLATVAHTAVIVERLAEAGKHLLAAVTPSGKLIGAVTELAQGRAEEAVGAGPAQDDELVTRRELNEIASEYSSQQREERAWSAAKGWANDQPTRVQQVSARWFVMRAHHLVSTVTRLWDLAHEYQRAKTIVEKMPDALAEQDAHISELLATTDEAMRSLQSDIDSYERAMQQEQSTLASIEPTRRAYQRAMHSSCGEEMCAKIAADGRALKLQRDRDVAAERSDLRAKAARVPEDIVDKNKHLATVRDELQRLETDAVAELTKRDVELLALRDEKDRALWELRAGLFCSKCMRTKSEIEHEEHVTFEAHLGRVRGQAVHAPASAIREKAAEYDRRIEDLEQRREELLKQLLGRDKQLRDDLAAMTRERDEVWQDHVRELRDAAARVQGWEKRAVREEADSVRKANQCRQEFT